MLGARRWLLLGTLALGCSGVTHRFSPKAARDYDIGHVPVSERAVLLIPENTRLRAYLGTGPSFANAMLRTRPEEYQGPARIFLAPGPHDYELSITTDQGEAHFDLQVPVKAGERYLLDVRISGDTATTAVLRLTEASYRELYP